MKKLALGALLTGFLAACGGGGSGDDIQQTDAGSDGSTPIDAPNAACNPVNPPGQQGCAANEKCTWIRIQADPTAIGKVGCVPDGSVAPGDACTNGAVGETTGFDDCAAGNICISGTCQDICGFDGGANSACDTGYHCTQYNALFANDGEDPVAGACNPTCNVLTQLQDVSGESCGTNRGCYIVPGTTETFAVCAGAGSGTQGSPITTPFVNACDPGFAPRQTAPGVATYECTGLCQPNDVAQGRNEADEAGVGPLDCITRGANPPDSASDGNSCRYYWAFENAPDATPLSNSVGLCWNHTQPWYDDNGDGTRNAPLPRCVNLTDEDILYPVMAPPNDVPDTLWFWCSPFPLQLQGAPARSMPKLNQIPHNDVVNGWL